MRYIIWAVCLLLTLTGCQSKVKDSNMEYRVSNLEIRVSELEEKLKLLNTTPYKTPRTTQRNPTTSIPTYKYQENSTRSSGTSSYSSGRCQATTKKGTQCKRSSRSGGYCWQHGG